MTIKDGLSFILPRGISKCPPDLGQEYHQLYYVLIYNYCCYVFRLFSANIFPQIGIENIINLLSFKVNSRAQAVFQSMEFWFLKCVKCV